MHNPEQEGRTMESRHAAWMEGKMAELIAAHPELASLLEEIKGKEVALRSSELTETLRSALETRN